MSIAEKIAALFDALTQDDLKQLSPVQRQRFQAQCGYWAEQAKPRPVPKVGVLSDLRTGRTDE